MPVGMERIVARGRTSKKVFQVHVLLSIPLHPVGRQVAYLFEDEKRRHDPVATADDLARDRKHATHALVVLIFVTRLRFWRRCTSNGWRRSQRPRCGNARPESKARGSCGSAGARSVRCHQPTSRQAPSLKPTLR